MSAPARGTPLCVALCSVLLASCQVDLERMLDQHKAEAYEASRFFEDGQSMRKPPVGTVAIDALTGPPELLSGMRGQAYIEAIPVPIDVALLQRGRNRFRIFCATCHGPLGDGASEVAENMKLRKPPSLHEARLVNYPPGRMYRVIAEGYGLMPAYPDELGVTDRWAVVAFIGALQMSQDVALLELPAGLRQEAQAWLR
jgi:mono/diheme cytochrome c family protein